MKHTWKVVGQTQSLPIMNPESLEDVDFPCPEPKERGLLVRAGAIPVTPKAMVKQHPLRTLIARWVDSDNMQSTPTESPSHINVAHLRMTHVKIESQGAGSESLICWGT